MKIRTVKWKNHPILGDLLLDFVDTDSDQPYETVIFAGENGTGKSTILEDLSSFLNLGSFKNFEYIEYVVKGAIFKALPSSAGHNVESFFDIEGPDGTIQQILRDKSNGRHDIEKNDTDLRSYGCVFSKARADYKTGTIKSTATSSLDKEKYNNDNEDDFTSLKQLIVDVENQDNADYTEINKSRNDAPQAWRDYYPNSKIYRFKNSFDTFFQGLAYDKVVNESGEKVIKFIKNGKAVSIDKLSTGEKQIVFRGIFLLKNSGILQDSAIMIDEPELSMHPKWQEKILQYYKSLFTNVSGKQTCQLFFATHSDHVLKHALANQGRNIVVTLEHEGDKIVAKKIDAPAVLPSITSAETNFLAFDLISNDYHIELYGWLQDKTSKNTIKSCDTFICDHNKYQASHHEKVSHHGNTTYKSLPTYIRNAIHHPDSGNVFTQEELRTSIKLLIELCK
ncbi:ATP-binding protein [Delftia sp. SD018]|uniref:AAA family ATPase n=1 Tax=unclassified Delftia TaxID=2613839 RepID=UPI001A972470|nr:MULTISPECIES: AAA family ATPase [unclassified Delftia]MBO0990979.1 ATP-binding protein [Delftia sp. SD083]MBO1035937.1 ATP-binding protein [Delftia sp. SD018]